MGSVHGACGVYVLDGGSVHIAERGAVVTVGSQAECHGVASTEEGALELVIARARHRRDADVGTKHVSLVGVGAVGVVNPTGKGDPVSICVDDVGGGLCTAASDFGSCPSSESQQKQGCMQ